MKPARSTLAVLGISGALLVSLAAHEGYREKAYIPVAGDRPTIGYGDAGPDVRLGQKTDPVRAMIRLYEQADQHAQALAKCMGPSVTLYAHEWDAYVSWAYNVGTGAACKSTLVKKVQAKDYAGACRELLRWDRFQGKRLAGLTKRREAEYRQCMGLSQ